MDKNDFLRHRQGDQKFSFGRGNAAQICQVTHTIWVRNEILQPADLRPRTTTRQEYYELVLINDAFEHLRFEG